MSSKHTYTWNDRYLIRDDKPWLPVMGEFHYSRCPRSEWRQQLYNMKACGVEIVATYVFWIHHEEEEGRYDFTGQRDLRAFLDLCGDMGFTVWLRIGPWCHGEARHGGFPDWLEAKPFPLRCNGEEYLACVRRWWEEIYRHAGHALYKHGGPIIGIQLENEFGHCGGSGEDDHIDVLRRLANDVGFEAPYYTATGWGGAKIGSALPVMACYCDAPWDRRLCKLPPSPNYLFSHERNDVDVGSDFQRGANVTFDEDAYPYLLAEMGGGIGSTLHRRLTASPADTAAMALVKLGSGANLLGYYMFCGGTNPGPNLNETRDSGSWCETPVLTYQAHSPLAEYGQITPLAKELKLLHLFLRSWGEALAPLPAEIPHGTAVKPEDDRSPRFAFRQKDGSGFLFINNHRRGYPLPDMTYDVPGFGQVEAPSGHYAILPMNLPLGDAVLKKAHASPLCVLNGSTFVFYCDGDPAYDLDGDCSIVTLTREEALNAWPITQNGVEKLVICPAPLVETQSGYAFIAREDAPWRCMPEGSGVITVPKAVPSVTTRRIATNYLCHDVELTLHYDGPMQECFLQVPYQGSLAELFVDGVKVADHLYDGENWEVALRRFGYPETITLRIYALFEGMPVYVQNPPEYVDGRALALGEVTLVNEYHIPYPG